MAALDRLYWISSSKPVETLLLFVSALKKLSSALSLLDLFDMTSLFLSKFAIVTKGISESARRDDALRVLFLSCSSICKHSIS